VYSLIVGHFHVSDNAGHLCAEWGEIATHKGIIRYLLDPAAFPRIPIPGQRDHHGSSEQQN
jgi:hypothetical protein